MPEFNPFVNDFNKLREFLRIIYLFGCYSRDDSKKFDISNRKFDDELRRIRNFIKEESYLSHQKNGKKVYPCIIQDFFKDAQNPLINIYFAKTATPLETTLFFLILQILNQSCDKKLNKEQILTELDNALEDRTSDADISTSAFRMLKKLESIGIVKYVSDERVYCLSNLVDDIFKDFDSEELKRVYTAILFFSNVYPPHVTGWFLKETIKKYLQTKNLDNFINKIEDTFWFTYVTHHHVLDEALVWDFWRALSESNKVKILYKPRNSKENREYICTPIKIIYDVKLGRWYFIVLHNNTLNTFPVSRVTFLEKIDQKFCKDDIKKYDRLIQNSFFVSVPYKKKEFTKVRIKFIMDEKNAYNFILNRVKRELKSAKIERVDDYEFIAQYYVSNIKEFKPWLRTFGHRAVVLDDKPLNRLRSEMIEDWKEILKNYGDI